jgi:hypothetical protein
MSRKLCCVPGREAGCCFMVCADPMHTYESWWRVAAAPTSKLHALRTSRLVHGTCASRSRSSLCCLDVLHDYSNAG